MDPYQFEDFVFKNKTILNNDPLKEMLLYPVDDVSCVVLPRRWRTVNTTVPDARAATACPLLTRQALLSYASSWNLVHYKYSAYSGSFVDLPRYPSILPIKEDVYESDLDVQVLDKNLITNNKTDCIKKQGYLLKGPEIGSDRIFINIGSKSFKKRYCHLRQHVDGSYVLDIHKDDKKEEVKHSIMLEFCTDVIKNPKRCRNCFEIHMETGTKGYTFATENEADLESWINTLTSVLQQSKADESSNKNDNESEFTSPAIYGTLKGLEHSMNPQLISYSKETSASIAVLRNHSRKNLFISSNNMAPTPEPQVESYKEQFGQRILLKCESLKFRLQAPIDGEKELLCQVEPYHTYLTLFDARNGKKLSENFYFNINHPAVKNILPEEVNSGLCIEQSDMEPKFNFNSLPEQWFQNKKQAVLSINNPHSDIFIVVRIDKILQGNVNQVTEPYIKAAKDPRLGLKVHKTVQSYASRLGAYKMPFAWAAKPLFRLYSNELDTGPDFPAIYRQEPGKMTDEDLLKILSDYRKPDKLSKLTLIPGWIKINIETCVEQPPNSLTSNWAPVKPFPLEPLSPCTLEVAPINISSEHPYTVYTNHLYVYPNSLNFDSQKAFVRARNIACTVELRDSDCQGAKSLDLIYGCNGMVNKKTCPVVHHNTNPCWYEEVKIKLPVMLTSNHHLLFTFYHVSCDIAKKLECGVETCVGYSWVPLLKGNKLVEEIVTLPVSTHLPSGYLSIQPLGLGRGNSGPETVWIEGEKPLFKCLLTLDSTILTRDSHLHNLFSHIEKITHSPTGAMPSELETCKILKASHAIQSITLIQFLPTILNQLFELLTFVQGTSDVGVQTVRLIVHLVHMIYDAGRRDLLESYIKYVFLCVGNGVHEHLMSPLFSFVESTQQDFLLGHKLMQHSEFFFQIITKSMAQYLFNTGKINMPRSERFPESFKLHIQKLMTALEPSYILQQPVQTHVVNKNVAVFLKKCLTFMDRGFIFQQTTNYLNKFKPGEPKALFDFKFSFIQTICQHEHYVAFNLPLLSDRIAARDWGGDIDNIHPSDLFIKRHFLAGTLLRHIYLSLNEAPQKRKFALSILRDLLVKHEMDDRYKAKSARGTIASLYAPWLPIVCGILHRLISKDCSNSPLNGDKSSDLNLPMNMTLNAFYVPKDNNVNSNTCTPKRNRLTLHFEDSSPNRSSTNLKESSFFVPLIGNGYHNGMYNNSTDSNLSSLSGEGYRNSSIGVDTTIKNYDKDRLDAVNRFGVLSKDEIHDVLMCFLFVVKYLDDNILLEWWGSCTQNQLHSFFNVLELCIDHFSYKGKNNILADAKANVTEIVSKSKPVKARTLPARMSPPDFSKEPPSTLPEKNNTVNRDNLLCVTKAKDGAAEHTAKCMGWLSTEIGLIVVDRVCLFTEHMGALGGAVARPLVALIKIPQSEQLYKHLFSALRAYINQFGDTLFMGNGLLCGKLVSALLKGCDSHMPSLRQECSALLYLLMRGNFEFTQRKGITRIHLQVIIGVSEILGSVVSLNNTRFQESLSLINSYASSDKVMKGSGFPVEVKELTHRIRTVLVATEEIAVRGGVNGVEQERLAELQHTLAVSYRATPRLRHAWLHTMAQHHTRALNHDEAMCCQLHIAALIAEYLKLRGCHSWGAETFGNISSNISRDEIGLKVDPGMVDVQYSELGLLEQLETCSKYMEKAERYELLGPLYRLILPIYEKQRNYEAIANCYHHLTQSYNKVLEIQNTGRRLLGRYYRVAFHNQVYFGDECGIEYIYKEPKVTTLSEISERLIKLYEHKFGNGMVKIVMDSAPVVASDLDERFAHIQVTSVQPYFDCSELSQERLTEFDKNHDVKRFMYETPFTKDGKVRGSVEEQWKRRTILTTDSTFPYVKKRIVVVDTHIEEKSPIEVAFEEMQNRVLELNDIVNAKTHDAKKLQLRLQGSVCVQVNAGPLAYASAFLGSTTSSLYPEDKVKALQDIFRDFIQVCQTALKINRNLIAMDQLEYQEALEENYKKICNSLTTLTGENMTKMRNGDITPKKTISGAQTDSSTA